MQRPGIDGYKRADAAAAAIAKSLYAPLKDEPPVIKVEEASPGVRSCTPDSEDDTVLMDTECLVDKDIQRANGLRPIMAEKQMALDAAADSAEQIKKGNQKEFPVDFYLVDRLVKNI